MGGSKLAFILYYGIIIFGEVHQALDVREV